MKRLLLLLLFPLVAHGEFLELRRVVKPGETERKLTRAGKTDGGEEFSEELTLSDAVIVKTSDVLKAVAGKQEDATGKVYVSLTKEGGEKMSAATADFSDHPRIAIVLDGKLVAAPEVLAQIGGNFQISFANLSEAKEAAKKINAAAREEKAAK